MVVARECSKCKDKNTVPYENKLFDTVEAQERAIDVQITRLRKKIEIDPKSPRYLQTVRSAGYMFAPD